MTDFASDPAASQWQINTRRVSGRRRLHFDHPRQIVEDAQRVAQGRFQPLGNLSAGQIFMHLARSIDISIDGLPERPAWPIRFLARTVFKKWILTRPMRAGVRLPDKFSRRLIPPETTTEAGLKGLREAVARLESTRRRRPSPLLGPLTVDEWNQLHCRHAELHLSFLGA